MSNGLEMQTGPRFLKPAIFGAIAIAFGVVTYAVVSSGDEAPKAAAANVEQNTLASTDTAAEPAVPMGDAALQADATVAAAPAATEPMTDTTAAADTTAMPAPAAEPAPASTTMPSAAAMPAPTVAAAKPEPAASSEMAMSEPSESAPANDEVKEVADNSSSKPAAEPKMLRAPSPPASEALRAWWATPATPQRLGVEYVGQAADQNSLVIRFTQQVSDPAAQQNIRVLDDAGKSVAANWQTGEHPSVLYAPNLEPGRYTVVIGPELAGIQGGTLGTQLHGPAFIQ